MEEKIRNIFICFVLVGTIVFIGAMLGTSLRKLSTEEGNYLHEFYRITRRRLFLQSGLRRELKLGVQNLGNSIVNT